MISFIDFPIGPALSNEDAIGIIPLLLVEPTLGLKPQIPQTMLGQEIEPLVTWGTSPQDVSPITGEVTDPEKEKDQDRKTAMYRS